MESEAIGHRGHRPIQAVLQNGSGVAEFRVEVETRHQIEWKMPVPVGTHLRPRYGDIANLSLCHQLPVILTQVGGPFGGTADKGRRDEYRPGHPVSGDRRHDRGCETPIPVVKGEVDGWSSPV